jgi:hypothetical protein
LLLILICVALSIEAMVAPAGIPVPLIFSPTNRLLVLAIPVMTFEPVVKVPDFDAGAPTVGKDGCVATELKVPVFATFIKPFTVPPKLMATLFNVPGLLNWGIDKVVAQSVDDKPVSNV